MGCRGAQEFAEVEGVLLMDGKPLPNVFVQFHPEPKKDVDHAPSSEATTDEQGRFHLYLPQKQRTGAAIGNHRICLVDLNVKDGQTSGSSRVPPRFSLDYSRSDATDLRWEVKSGSQNIELKVTRRFSPP